MDRAMCWCSLLQKVYHFRKLRFRTDLRCIVNLCVDRLFSNNTEDHGSCTKYQTWVCRNYIDVKLLIPWYLVLLCHILNHTENYCRIGDIEGLYVLGEPDMTVIAFASKELNIYKVNEAMADRGWSLNALHKPSRYTSLRSLLIICRIFLRVDSKSCSIMDSVHICVTLQHVDTVDAFLKDLKGSVEYVSTLTCSISVPRILFFSSSTPTQYHNSIILSKMYEVHVRINLIVYHHPYMC